MSAVEDRIWAGWWTDDEEFTTTAARLENISRGGAKVRMLEEPEVAQDVWLRLADPFCSDSLRATVLEVVSSHEGDYWVRILFAEPCPDAFFESVTKGYVIHQFAESITDA